MKKLILAVSLIIVLLSVYIGVVLVNAVGPTSSNPSLNATVIPSGLNVLGNNWGPNTTVSLFIDGTDPINHVADVTPTGFGGMKFSPSAMGWRGLLIGSFQLTIPLNGISVGTHTLTGIQDVTAASAGAQSSIQVTVPFTILLTSPVDDRVSGIGGEVNQIEGKLDGTVPSLLNGTNGLSAIKGLLTGTNGLANIKSDTQNIKTSISTQFSSVHSHLGNIEDILYGDEDSILTDIEGKLDGSNGLAAIKSNTTAINTEVNKIEGKLDGNQSSLLNGSNGLAAIKGDTSATQTNVSDIKSIVDDPTSGIAATNTEVNKIEGKLDGTQSSMVTKSSSASGDLPTALISYPSIRHVSLTIWVGFLNGGDTIEVLMNGTLPFVPLYAINAAGGQTYQFDTNEWEIIGGATGVWNATTTYGLEP